MSKYKWQSNQPNNNKNNKNKDKNIFSIKGKDNTKMILKE